MTRKSTASTKRNATRKSRANRSAAPAFELWLQPRRDVTLQEVEDQARHLEAFLGDRGLTAEGTHLRLTVRGSDRDPTVEDLVDVVCWLAESERVNSVRAKPLSPVQGHGLATVLASRSDLALPWLVNLYGLGRLEAPVVARALAADPWIDPQVRPDSER